MCVGQVQAGQGQGRAWRYLFTPLIPVEGLESGARSPGRWAWQFLPLLLDLDKTSKTLQRLMFQRHFRFGARLVKGRPERQEALAVDRGKESQYI